jgi:hypothetical protein
VDNQFCTKQLLLTSAANEKRTRQTFAHWLLMLLSTKLAEQELP